MMDEDVCILFRVNQSLNTFWRKGCPEREVHCLNTQVLCRYLISIENSRCLCGVTSCHDLPSGVSWSCAPRQEPDWQLVLTSAILSYVCFSFSFWYCFNLASSSVWWQGLLPTHPPNVLQMLHLLTTSSTSGNGRGDFYTPFQLPNGQYYINYTPHFIEDKLETPRDIRTVRYFSSTSYCLQCLTWTLTLWIMFIIFCNQT